MQKYLDKICHFSVSINIVVLIAGLLFLLTGLSNLESVAIAAPISLAIGVAKEIYDSKHGSYFDILDLLSDIFGTGIGVLLVQMFEV